MTVQSASNKTIVLGNGAATTFDFDFVGVASAFISVIFTDADGNETTLSQGSGTTQYQISLNAAAVGALWGVGGTITYNPNGTPIAAGTSLTISRTLPLTQAVSLQFLGSLATLGNGAETGLDTLEMQLQQISETIARAILAPITDPTPPANLPPIAQRANKGAAFDSAGNLVAGALPSSGVISSVMQPVVNAATLAVARNALGLGSIATEGIGLGLADNGAGEVEVLPPLVEVGANQSVTLTNHTTNYMASGTLTFTLPRADTLFSGFYIEVYALTAPITFTIDPHDTVFGQASGAAYTVPAGCYVRISTNALATGTWFPKVAGISPKLNVKTFTAVGGTTYTPTKGLIAAVVELVGGGGAGGGAQGATGAVISGGGGGGGAYGRSVLTAAQIGAGQIATVGAGGIGVSGGAGTAGAQSSFGTLVTAPGGSGGGTGNSSSPGPSGAGGATSGTAQVAIGGAPGALGLVGTSTAIQTGAGTGGHSILGAGGVPVTAAGGSVGVNGNPGQSYGGGGSGAQVNNVTGAVTGGAGANGIVIVTELIAAVA